MKILTNANYEEIINKLNDQLGEIIELQSKYGLLKANYDANINVIKELNGRIGGLTKEINRTKEQNDVLIMSAKIKDKSNAELTKALANYGEVIKERDCLKLELERAKKALEESMSDKFYRVSVPAGKLPKGQVMHMKSHAARDKLIKKIYADLEKDK